MVIGIGNGPDMGQQRKVIFPHDIQVFVQLHDAAGIALAGAALGNVQMTVVLVVADAVSVVEFQIADGLYDLAGGEIVLGQDGFIVRQIAACVGTVVDGGGGYQIGDAVLFIHTGALRALEFVFGILRLAGVDGQNGLRVGVAGMEVGDTVKVMIEAAGIGVDPSVKAIACPCEQIAGENRLLVVNAVGVSHFAEGGTVPGIVNDIHLGLPERIECHAADILRQNRLILVFAFGSGRVRDPAAEDIAIAGIGAGGKRILAGHQYDGVHFAGAAVCMEGYRFRNRIGRNGPCQSEQEADEQPGSEGIQSPAAEADGSVVDNGGW